MMVSSRVATITRLKMSRPNWSVPNQCAEDGGFRAAAVSDASGSCGTTYGPNTAANRMRINRPNAKPVTRVSPRTERAWSSIVASPDVRSGAMGSTAGATLLMLASSFKPYSWVDHAVKDIDGQVEQHIHDRHREHEALHRRKVR